jgi:hypothetical protein
MPKCELSMRVDRSNAHHLLPLNSSFRDLSERPNNRSSCLMIPRILKCQNAKMGSTSHGMHDRWPFGTPHTGSSRFSIPTHLPHQFPNSEIATLFRDFVYREFETLGSKNHLSPLLPGPRKPKCRNSTPMTLRVSRLRGFQCKAPRLLVIRISEMSNPDMPKCRCFTPKAHRVSRLRDFQC